MSLALRQISNVTPTFPLSQTSSLFATKRILPPTGDQERRHSQATRSASGKETTSSERLAPYILPVYILPTRNRLYSAGCCGNERKNDNNSEGKREKEKTIKDTISCRNGNSGCCLGFVLVGRQSGVCGIFDDPCMKEEFGCRGS